MRILNVTAWRSWSEVFSRRRHHWDKKRNVLVLEKGETKNGEAREYPLDEELIEILEEQEAETMKLERQRSKNKVYRTD